METEQLHRIPLTGAPAPLPREVKCLRSALLGVSNLGSDATRSGTTGMEVARGEQGLQGGELLRQTMGMRTSEVGAAGLPGWAPQWGEGEQRRDHRDGEVSVHLVRQTEMMLRGRLWKNGSQGCTEQAACQRGQGSGRILPSFRAGFGLDLWRCSACSLCPPP